MTVTPKSCLAIAAVAFSTLALSACSQSIPPGDQIAKDVIDTLNVSDAKKACMHAAVDEFTVPVAVSKQWTNLDEVAAAAAQDPPNAQAQGIIDDFFKKVYDDCPDTAASSGDSGTASSAASG